MEIDPPSQAQVFDMARALAAFSHPVRLAILYQLQAPKILAEIEVKVPRGEEEKGPREKPLSRQAIREHLDVLVAVGAVARRPTERDRGPTFEYGVNPQRIYAISDAFRSLARLRPAEPPPEEQTVRGSPTPPALDRFHGLVLVKGADEGQRYPFAGPRTGLRSWVIGRRRGLAVSLEYDPFVSTLHASIEGDEGTYLLQDMPDSRNGTNLNFERIPKGEPQALRHGDIIGVGRSLLLFVDGEAWGSSPRTPTRIYSGRPP